MRSISDEVSRIGGAALIANRESIALPYERSGVSLFLFRVSLIAAWVSMLVFGLIIAVMLVPSMWLCRRVPQFQALCRPRKYERRILRAR